MHLKGVVDRKWFPAFDLGCAATAVILWLLSPGLGAFPLLIGLLPALLRLLAGRSPLARTPFDLPILVFLLTAGMGVWAAYDMPAAWTKFWLLVSAALLFYATAGQPPRNRWALAGFLSLIGAGLALVYLLTGSWEIYPAKIDTINRLALGWMRIRPSLPFLDIHPNNVAGIVAFCAPFSVAIALRSRKAGPRRALVWAVAALLVSGAAFLLATSRGAAFALAGGVLVWVMQAWTRRFRLPAGWSGRPFLRATLAAALLLVTVVALAALWSLFQLQPGAERRLDYSSGALRLFQDFLFTGGGLSGFPGLYSQYILVINTFFVLNSHNLFLDIGLEQGIFGLLAFAVVYAGSLWMAATYHANAEDSSASQANSILLARAALNALAIVLLHGLLDTVIYDPGGSPLIFFLPGITVAFTLPYEKKSKPEGPHRKWRIWLGAGLAFFLALTLLAAYRPLLGALYANLGAVRMAKAELADFPRDQWNLEQNAGTIAQAGPLFERALALDPNQRAAHYRLGLIAIRERDFPNAVQHLQAAHQLDADHRGITKNLAYALVWNGQLDQAMPLLTTLPEAQVEMMIYFTMWYNQGENSLSARAQAAAEALKK